MDKMEEKQLNKSGLYEYRESHIRRTKNKYRMTFVKLYRFLFDIVLFYLAWIWFRYGRFTDLSDYGFRYNYFVTIGWKVE